MQTLALYLKALETQRSRSPAGLAGETVGLPTDTAAAARREREPPRDGRARDADRALPRAPAPAPLQPRSGTAVQKKEPLLIEQLPAILMAMPDDDLATRDRAQLLLGHAGAFRRSELVALDVEQLRFSRSGCYVWIASAKMTHRERGVSFLYRGCQR